MDNNQVDKSKVLNILVDVAIGILIAVVLVIVCTECAVQKPTVIYRDSVRVEYRDRIVRDTVSYEVPIEKEKIVTRDTMSHLQNTFAESDAVVSGGFLTHSLKSRPQIIKIPVEVEVHDTLIVEKCGETITETVTVEKELNWWQRFRLKGFWWLLAGLVGCLVWIFRKPIMALIKTVI